MPGYIEDVDDSYRAWWETSLQDVGTRAKAGGLVEVANLLSRRYIRAAEAIMEQLGTSPTRDTTPRRQRPIHWLKGEDIVDGFATEPVVVGHIVGNSWARDEALSVGVISRRNRGIVRYHSPKLFILSTFRGTAPDNLDYITARHLPEHPVMSAESYDAYNLHSLEGTVSDIRSFGAGLGVVARHAELELPNAAPYSGYNVDSMLNIVGVSI
ncbi:MAG TPA: hypothetical protein VH234_02815 [Candidatus Saccharimonadales bacterium]|jgi:hypothetical protein|nr:hypothetical protein [Candidatus Saccharimonadales bacterium]